jgi:hypothetical protein
MYHQWKWQVLLVYAGFICSNTSDVTCRGGSGDARSPIDHHTIGWITASSIGASWLAIWCMGAG